MNGLSLSAGRSDAKQRLHAPDIDRSIHAINVVLIEFQIAGQNIDELLRHAGFDLQAHRIAKSAAPHGFLDALEKVLRFEFLNGQLGIACHVKNIGLQDFHLREKHPQIGNDGLFQPNESQFTGVRRYRQQMRQRARHLDTREPLHPVAVADRSADIKAQI